MEQLALLHASLWDAADLDDHEWLTRRSENGGEAFASIYEAFVSRSSPSTRIGSSDSRSARRRALHPRGRRLAVHRRPNHSRCCTATTAWRTCSSVTARAPRRSPPSTGRPSASEPAPAMPPTSSARGCTPRIAAPTNASCWRSTAEGLVAQGVELSAEDCWNSYRVNAFAGLHMAVVASVLVGRTEHGDEMFLAMAERHAAHVDDLDSWALVASELTAGEVPLPVSALGECSRFAVDEARRAAPWSRHRTPVGRAWPRGLADDRRPPCQVPFEHVVLRSSEGHRPRPPASSPARASTR